MPINKPRKQKSGTSIGSIIFGVFGIGLLVALLARLKGDVREEPYHGEEFDLTEEPVAKIYPGVEAVNTKSCPGCNNVTVPDKLFCIWCGTYVPNPKVGKKSRVLEKIVHNSNRSYNGHIPLHLYYCDCWVDFIFCFFPMAFDQRHNSGKMDTGRKSR